jgi:hypothetical protein
MISQADREGRPDPNVACLGQVDFTYPKGTTLKDVRAAEADLRRHLEAGGVDMTQGEVLRYSDKLVVNFRDQKHLDLIEEWSAIHGGSHTVERY